LGLAFASSEVGDEVVVDLRPPTLSANPDWTGELLVFVSDPSVLGGKRYVGGESLTQLQRGHQPVAHPDSRVIEAAIQKRRARVVRAAGPA